MFLELGLKGKRIDYYSLCKGSFHWNMVQSRPVVRGRGTPSTPAMERQSSFKSCLGHWTQLLHCLAGKNDLGH